MLNINAILSLTYPLRVWDTLSQWLPSRDENSDFWWQTTGPHLATLLFQAGYTIHQQYQGLLFHYHVVTPHFGPMPLAGGTPRWKSFMTDDFTPLETSWKWNTSLADSRPEVRYSIEAIGLDAGVVADPLNQVSTKEMIKSFDTHTSSLDSKHFNHFAKAFFNEENMKEYMAKTGSHNGSTMFLAAEFLGDGFAFKSYFVPVQAALPAGQTVADAIVQSIRSLGEKNVALDTYLDFVSDYPDEYLKPFMVGIDCVEPSRSRIKVYVRSSRTSFDSVQDILTLGGLRQVDTAALADMRDLWRLTLQLPEDFNSAAELPYNQHLTSGILYHIDLQPGKPLPDVKCYIPVRHYARNDLEVANGLAKFLIARGRGSYVENFMVVLKNMVSYRPLDRARGAQTYITAAFAKDGLSITSYFNPEVYHPDKWTT